MFKKISNKIILFLILIIFFTANIFPVTSKNADNLKENKKIRVSILSNPVVYIDYLSKTSAFPGDLVTIFGSGFGDAAGLVVLTGLKILADSWSDTEIMFTVPEDGASGEIYIRDSDGAKSNSVIFSVDRLLSRGQFEPYGFQHDDIGLLGAAFLVETDGSYFYGIAGFETLCVYEILDNESYKLCCRTYLNQRVGDLKIHDGYLFCSGDHGLIVYSCSDLQNNNPKVVAAIAGGSYMTLDIKDKDGVPIDGMLLALCEYIPVRDSNVLRVPFYVFDSEELEYLGSYDRSVEPAERYHAIAIDPLNPKVYVSGLVTLLGNDKYILEIDISSLQDPFLKVKLDTNDILAFDMDALDDVLWTGVVSTGTEMFQAYQLYPGENNINLIQTVQGPFRLGRATRVKIIDDKVTVGSSWSGERPDVFLLDTFDSGTMPLASGDSLDWAFDVTGFQVDPEEGRGKIIVADEWGGFITYYYSCEPDFSITHDQDYDWVVAGAMTQEIYHVDDRIYVADRGGGPWSIDKHDLSDESSWRWVDWEWVEEKPQPHPVSGLCIRKDPEYGTLMAGLGHEKAMAWGTFIYGMLYKETEGNIELLAISDGIDPPGLYSTGIGVIWPETDLAYMTTGTDGFRAYIINVDDPSISIHKDCTNEGFKSDIYTGSNIANCMSYYTQDSVNKIIIGSKPGLFVSDSSLQIFNVTYPDGVPDKDNPDRAINIEKDIDLKCLKYKTVNHIDITSSGIVTLATSLGVAVFHISWIPELNKLSDSKAWGLIKIPDDTYLPFWDKSWTSFFADAKFADENTIYAVKNPEGLWRIDFEINWDQFTHKSRPSGFYPGVQCGINYSQLLSGWSNPDIVTLHHPYGLVVDGNTAYVHGWSGKVNKLTSQTENNPPSTPKINGPTKGSTGVKYDYTFYSTDADNDDIYYYIKWGDGTTFEWIGPYNPNELVTVNHTWVNQGSFKIEAKAKDIKNGASYWGSFDLSIPRNKYASDTFIFTTFEQVINFLKFERFLI
jgi:hypothetical protein